MKQRTQTYTMMLVAIAILAGFAMALNGQTNDKVEGPVIGIDLGTTYSCVGIYKNGRTEIIPNELGNRITPSFVAFNDQERLIGEAAKNQAAVNPDGSISVVKRLIGRKFTDDEVQKDMKFLSYNVVSQSGKPYVSVKMPGVGTKTLSPEEVSSMILTKMKTVAENYLGEEVKHAVITVPAYFNDAQRQATKDAGAIAGLNVLRIINEPTAAAMAYGLDKKGGEKNVLVYDFGGGTFDVSLLTIDNGVFEVVATAGDTHLGGEDLDQRLTSHFVKLFQKKNNIDISKDSRALQKLKGEVEKAKRDLSSVIQTKISIEGLINGVDFEENITRARFEEIGADIFKKTLKPVQQVLDDAGMKKSEIDEIVLVGGSTRIPKVQALLKDFFNGKEPNRGVNPDEAVAQGAAITACNLGVNQCEGLGDVVTLDVNPLTLGIETSGGVMTKIIPRGSMTPNTKSQTFTTNQDSQTTVTISVYEGERTLVKDNHLLGKFDLTGIPPAPRGTPQIEVTFDIGVDGTLSVKAVDKATSSTQSININDVKSNLSQAEIDRMLAEGEKFAESDKILKERMDSHHQLENYVHSMRNSLEDKDKLQEKLSEDDKTTINGALKDTQDWLAANPDSEKDNIDEQLKSLQKVCDPIVAKVYQNGGGQGKGSDEKDDEFEDI